MFTKFTKSSKITHSTINNSIQGCYKVMKSQENLRKTTKSRKIQVKIGFFEKIQEKSGNFTKF